MFSCSFGKTKQAQSLPVKQETAPATMQTDSQGRISKSHGFKWSEMTAKGLLGAAAAAYTASIGVLAIAASNGIYHQDFGISYSTMSVYVLPAELIVKGGAALLGVGGYALANYGVPVLASVGVTAFIAHLIVNSKNAEQKQPSSEVPLEPTKGDKKQAEIAVSEKKEAPITKLEEREEIPSFQEGEALGFEEILKEQIRDLEDEKAKMQLENSELRSNQIRLQQANSSLGKKRESYKTKKRQLKEENERLLQEQRKPVTFVRVQTPEKAAGVSVPPSSDVNETASLKEQIKLLSTRLKEANQREGDLKEHIVNLKEENESLQKYKNISKEQENRAKTLTAQLAQVQEYAGELSTEFDRLTQLNARSIRA